MKRWKVINNYPDYRVSRSGSIQSKRRNGCWRYLKTPLSAGYPCAMIYNEDGRKLIRVHQLVAEAFIGPKEPGFHIHHKDGNKLNSRADNLEYRLIREHHQSHKVNNFSASRRRWEEKQEQSLALNLHS